MLAEQGATAREIAAVMDISPEYAARLYALCAEENDLMWSE